MKGLFPSILVLISLFILAIPAFQIIKLNESSFSDNSSSTNSGSCLSCHISIIKKKVKHQPVTYDCLKCHKSNGNKHPQNGTIGFTIIGESKSLCFSCHSNLKSNIENAYYVHKAVMGNKYCTNCHSPHASEQKHLLAKEEKDLCFSCHNKTYSNGKSSIKNMKRHFKINPFKHKPVEEGCTSCHNAHFSENKLLLKKKNPEGAYSKASKESFELCFSCHNSDMIEQPLSEKVTNFRNGNENMHYAHIQGRKGRNCNLCHDVHASNNQFLMTKTATFGSWKMNINFTSTENGGTCNTGCHAEKKYDRKNKFINDPNFNIRNIRKYEDLVEEKTNKDDEKKVEETKKEPIVENKKSNEKNTIDSTEILALNVKTENDSSKNAKVIVTEKKSNENSEEIEEQNRNINQIVSNNNQKKEEAIKNIQKTTNLSNKHIKLQKDTCLLANYTFKIIDYRTGRNLIATINNGKLEIVNEGLKFFKYKIIHYVLSSVDNSRIPIIRNFDGTISHRALNMLKNAHIGAQYIFEEIIVVDPSGLKMENQVRSVLIERIK